jgi:hypothetical protein
MVCVRHGGTVRGRLREEAARAGAEGGEKIPNSHSSFRPTPAGLAAHPGNSDYFRVIPSNSDHRKNLRIPSSEECHAGMALSATGPAKVEALAEEDAPIRGSKPIRSATLRVPCVPNLKKVLCSQGSLRPCGSKTLEGGPTLPRHHSTTPLSRHSEATAKPRHFAASQSRLIKVNKGQ